MVREIDGVPPHDPTRPSVVRAECTHESSTVNTGIVHLVDDSLLSKETTAASKPKHRNFLHYLTSGWNFVRVGGPMLTSAIIGAGRRYILSENINRTISAAFDMVGLGIVNVNDYVNLTFWAVIGGGGGLIHAYLNYLQQSRVHALEIGMKAEKEREKQDVSALREENAANRRDIIALQTENTDLRNICQDNASRIRALEQKGNSPNHP